MAKIACMGKGPASVFNSLLDNKILDCSKLKAYKDDEFIVV